MQKISEMNMMFKINIVEKTKEKIKIHFYVNEDKYDKQPIKLMLKSNSINASVAECLIVLDADKMYKDVEYSYNSENDILLQLKNIEKNIQYLIKIDISSNEYEYYLL